MRKSGLKRSLWPVVMATSALAACSPSDTMTSSRNAGEKTPAHNEQTGTVRALMVPDAQMETEQRSLARQDASGHNVSDEAANAPVLLSQSHVLVPQAQAPAAAPGMKAERRSGGRWQSASALQPALQPALEAHAQGAVRGSAKLTAPAHRILPPRPVPPSITPDRERYGDIDENPLKLVSQHPVSTFSIDVDTGSYANVRRFLMGGRLPPADAVRVEEMLNYFDYGYASPKRGETPFSVTTELGVTPWNPRTRLLQIGVQGVRLSPAEVPPSNLVFLIDVSGSMRSHAKLGLLKAGLIMLTNQLRAEDRVSLVVYAGSSGVVLEPTPGNQTHRITSALKSLQAGGSTHGSAGIELAYAKARQAFIQGGVNRVLLATDGDFNVGTTDFKALKALIKRERASGVSLTTLGFGTGNLNEQLMEQLADVGNGNYAYIDSAREANKVLVKQMAGTLATIAKDVKIQIEFNPAVVSEYRLIGYENRQLRREDFRNDKVDAGEIGAGHSVTALYEVSLAGSDSGQYAPLRYQQSGAPAKRETAVITPEHDRELAFLRMRYKAPGGATSKLVVTPISAPDGDSDRSVSAHSGRFKLAAAVAGFGQLLRDGRYIQAFGFDDVVRLATDAQVDDSDGYVAEFRQLASVASSLTGHQNLQSRAQTQRE